MDLSDEGMRRWRTKFAREMLLYALLFIGMSFGAAYMSGLMWDKTIARFATNPMQAVRFLLEQFLILAMLAGMIWMCLRTARETWSFNRKMDTLRSLDPPDVPG
jgi:TRAP-type C4-dicarboxylate transport system permease small subunit